MLFCKLLNGILCRDKHVLLWAEYFGKKSLKRNLFPCRKSSSSSEPIVESSEEKPLRKLLRVAILGKTNVGKSTLINKIMNVNVCDASFKAHTTRFLLKAAFVSGNTQIIIVDTPGLVTKKEFRRFSLSEEFLNWKKKIFQEVDVVGIVQCVPRSRRIKGFSIDDSVIKILNEIPESKPVFLIINKMDLLEKKFEELQRLKELVYSEDSEDCDKPNYWKRFSKVFFISALKSRGIADMMNYLLREAKPKEWLLEPETVCDTPLQLLIKNLLRGKMLDFLPKEVPYNCSFEVEYLEEDVLERVNCLVSIKCRRFQYVNIIFSKKRNQLKQLIKELESDLYSILGKVVKLKIITQAQQKH